MLRWRSGARRAGRLILSACTCLALAGCGAKTGAVDHAATPADVAATPAATVTLAATPPPARPTLAMATAAPSILSASWLRNATPWAGWLAPATPAANAPAATGSAALIGWKPFASQDGGFSVWLPGDPSSGFQTLPTPAGPVTLHTFLSQNDASGYYIGYADYPVGLLKGVDMERVLDGARDGALQLIHGTLLSETDVTMAGMPARQVVIRAPSQGLPQGIVVTARFGLLGDRQYQLQAFSAGEPSAADSARFEAFFDSFSLTQ